MNCQDFERTIIDSGFDHLIEAPKHMHVLAHAETCAQCAARLDREQRTTAGLQALAVEEAAMNAPERVRLALRVAFDQQRAAIPSPPVSLSSRRSGLLWGLAAAAMLLLFTVTTALWLREQRAKVGNTPPVSAAPPISPVLPGNLPEAQQTSGIHPPPAPATRPSGRGGRRRTIPVEESSDDAAKLFPLTFVAKSGPAEFVQTVRVEISRSTLLLMGLPINIDRGEGLIKADLIIGEDGVARAVRLLN